MSEFVYWECEYCQERDKTHSDFDDLSCEECGGEMQRVYACPVCHVEYYVSSYAANCCPFVE